MNTLTLTALLLATVGVFSLQRRWVPVPFLILACYISTATRLDLGQFSFTPLRALTFAALVRGLLRSDWKGIVVGAPDYLMLLWAVLMVGTVAFHNEPALQLVGRLGMTLDGFGLYIVIRLFCRSQRDITFLCSALCVSLAPLAVLMLYEKASAYNLLSLLGSGTETPSIRDGEVRAQGPFRHAILAGSIGAISVPLVATLLPKRRLIALVGLVSCVCIVLSSTSSGPVISLAVALLCLALWPLRGHVSVLCWAGVALYFLLAAVMNRPPYYLITQIDFTGSSTAWHRARLIDAAFEHFDEWWLVGTDFTRHWMPTGVPWSTDHADVTNHYISLGILGGLPLVLSFSAVQAASFFRVGRQLARARLNGSVSFLPWALGSALLTIVVTGMSITYFDQSILWLHLTVVFCCSQIKEAEAAGRLRISGPKDAHVRRMRRPRRRQPAHAG